MFVYSKGLPIGKPDKSKPIPRVDDASRPVVICDSVLRVTDELMTENVPEDVRKNRRMLLRLHQIV